MFNELYFGFLPKHFIHLVNFILLNDSALAYQSQNQLSLMVSDFHIGECQSICTFQYIKFLFQSSLKLYQDTHQEYARVKEECLKTDAQYVFKNYCENKASKLETV